MKSTDRWDLFCANASVKSHQRRVSLWQRLRSWLPRWDTEWLP